MPQFHYYFGFVSNLSKVTSQFCFEIYKDFDFRQKILKHFVLRHINDSYDKMEMSATQKVGIITLIPKPDKQKKNSKKLEANNTSELYL